MTWNSVSPDGSRSVKANETVIQNNTTYIQTTMGNSAVGTNTVTTRDHFWNVGSSEDGRHRFIQSPEFTVASLSADPVIGTGMDGVLYIKEVNTDIARVEGFYRNSQGIYQYIPSFLSGSGTVNSSYSSLVPVPKNVYGEIFMYRTTLGTQTVCSGHFRSGNSTVEAWSFTQSTESSDTNVPLKFGSGSEASGLNIRVRTSDAESGKTWNYRITYRAI